MSMSTLESIVLIVVLIGWFGYRQSTWRPVDVGRMVRIPLILGAIGILALGGQAGGPASSLGPTDVVVVLLEVAVSLGVGAWMGAIAHLRPASGGVRSAAWESRTGAAGLVLWGLVVALRIGVDAFGAQLGLAITASTGVILLTLAANRLGRVLLLARRVDQISRPRRMMVR